MTLLDELAALVRELDAAGIEYALVGGLAVAIWGAPRATQDIDLLVRPESLAAALAAVEPRGMIDFIVVDANLEPVWASRQRLELAGAPIWVISRQALIQMKVAAGRPQDALDIQSLEELDR